MPKYVNIEPFMEKLNKELNKNARTVGHTHTYACFQHFYNMLKDLPVEEVRPVAHGYVIKNIGLEDECYWECSVCGTHEVYEDDRYCSECGARLDALPPGAKIRCSKCVYNCPIEKPNCSHYKTDAPNAGYY